MLVARRRSSYVAALALLLVAGMFNMWSHADERGSRIVFDPAPLPATIGDWQNVGENKADRAVHEMLQEDAMQWRTYKRGQQYADLLVLYGHRKRTFHLPDSCLAGAGIIIKSRQVIILTMPDGSVVPFHALMLRKDETSQIALYTFIGPGGNPTDLLGLNVGMLMCRIRGRGPKGAAIRVIGPVDPDRPLASQPVCDLAIAALKEVCRRVECAGPARDRRKVQSTALRYARSSLLRASGYRTKCCRRVRQNPTHGRHAWDSPSGDGSYNEFCPEAGGLIWPTS